MTMPGRKLRLHGRRASAVAALSLSALLLVSCGGDDEEETPTAEAPAAAETVEATEEAQGGLQSPETSPPTGGAATPPTGAGATPAVMPGAATPSS